MADGVGGEDRGVAGAAGQHHDACAGVERADERLGAHHADDVRAALDHRLVEVRRRVERLDAVFTEAALEVFLVLLGVYQREVEREAFLGCDLLDEGARAGELGIGAGGAGGADQQRDAEPAGALQHQPQVALDGLAGEHGLAGSEIGGAGIGGASVAADEVRLQAERAFQRGFEKARTAHAGGGYDADFGGFGHGGSPHVCETIGQPATGTLAARIDPSLGLGDKQHLTILAAVGEVGGLQPGAGAHPVLRLAQAVEIHAVPRPEWATASPPSSSIASPSGPESPPESCRNTPALSTRSSACSGTATPRWRG